MQEGKVKPYDPQHIAAGKEMIADPSGRSL
jgi:hypothetical protein